MQVSVKYKKLINYVVGPLLFVILTYSIYLKIIRQPHRHEAWQNIQTAIIHNRQLLFAIFVLMLINWGIEARKWQLLIKSVQKVSLFTGFKAVLSGLSFSLFMPNGIGDYVGRMLYMDEGNRLRSIAVNFVGGLSQLITTLLFGSIGLYYLMHYILPSDAYFLHIPAIWLRSLLVIFILLIGILLLLYFKIALFIQWFEKIKWIRKYRGLIDSLETFHYDLLLRVLLLAILRYAIFTTQYILMFRLFDVHIPVIAAIWSTSLLLLAMSIIPTIPVAELGIRGELGIKIFGLLSANTLAIVGVTGFVWAINSVLPSLVGSLFVLSLRVFKKNLSDTEEHRMEKKG